MILKTKIPHRVVKKDGSIKTYQPGEIITEKDGELLKQIQYHRLYRRDIYYSKLQEAHQPENQKGQKGLVNREVTKHPAKQTVEPKKSWIGKIFDSSDEKQSEPVTESPAEETVATDNEPKEPVEG